MKVVIAFIIRRARDIRLQALLLLLSFGCGPAKPVLIYVPPSISIDSAGSQRKTAAINSKSHSFWEAMSNLDTGYISRQQVTDREREFANALGLAMSGKYEDAALAMDAIRSTDTDHTLATAARLLVTAMLQYQDKWSTLAELDSMDLHRAASRVRRLRIRGSDCRPSFCDTGTPEWRSSLSGCSNTR